MTPSLEEPRQVVQQLVTKFLANSDCASLIRINEAYETLQANRVRRMAASRDTLHRKINNVSSVEWMKRVEAAKWEATRPADKTEDRHAESMAELERERLVLCKAINELESNTHQQVANHDLF